jgi:hypothetical protein
VHKAHAKRIAWFIQLQRLMQFQKYNLAPQRAALRRQMPVKDKSDRSRTFRLSERTFSSASLGTSSNVSYQERRPSNEPIKSPGAPASRMVVLPTIKNILGHLQNRDPSVAMRSFTGGFGIHSVHILLGTTVHPQHQNALGRQWPMIEMANGLRKSPRRLDVGGIGCFPPIADARISHFLVARFSYTDDRVERSLRAPPPPSEKENRFADKPYQPSHAGPEGALSYQPQQGKASSAATVHIDGSALGRWTIQHLERALGKPATGMTGVDPRASPPRSRVSPF